MRITIYIRRMFGSVILKRFFRARPRARRSPTKARYEREDAEATDGTR